MVEITSFSKQIYVDHNFNVCLAPVQIDFTYKGHGTFNGTGLKGARLRRSQLLQRVQVQPQPTHNIIFVLPCRKLILFGPIQLPLPFMAPVKGRAYHLVYEVSRTRISLMFTTPSHKVHTTVIPTTACKPQSTILDLSMLLLLLAMIFIFLPLQVLRHS